ncbi:hypothetical protein E2P64_08435 [Candidatus Bathyarchaeota archaeon]|nr:hypothetical protein E2P64_08435 [Candidatus Bathyarchaeota archaeon]
MENVEIRPNIHATRFEETVGATNWRKVEQAVQPIWEVLFHVFTVMKADIEFSMALTSALERMRDKLDREEVTVFLQKVTEDIFNETGSIRR